MDRELTVPLPHSPATVSSLAPEKWRRDADALARVEERFPPVAERAWEMLQRARGRRGAGMSSQFEGFAGGMTADYFSKSQTS